ncbi:Mg/Co/Ni transporter MgtE / CBS domain [Chitinispirillum alkaliphilum]|nr:Mg/Co/Ni transporter MgtE / CBS domain [Chitinispirillum alkaliphilum]
MENTQNRFDELNAIVNNHPEQAVETAKTMKAEDIAAGLNNASREELEKFFATFPKEFLTKVFFLLEDVVKNNVVHSISKEDAVYYLSTLAADDLVKVLDEMPVRNARNFLECMPLKLQRVAEKLMGYPHDTVGRIMSPDYLTFKTDDIVGNAQDLIREKLIKDESRDPRYIYIVDDEFRLNGYIPVNTVMVSDASRTVGSLLNSNNTNSVQALDPQEKAARHLQYLRVVELPVVDSGNHIVGILTADDAMEAIRESVTDDMFDKAGLLDWTHKETDRSHKLLHGSFFHVIGVRVPFLLFTLAGGMLAGAVIGAFEDILDAIAATAMFIPVIMDMGGNVGTQSSTIFTRGMVLGQIDLKRFFKQWLRETVHGFGMGCILGALGGFIAAIWQGMPELGWAVGISLALTITIGVSLGFMVPFVLIKMGFDQAAGADPIITTIKDMSGLVIYFTSVALLMPHIIEMAG